MNQQQDDLSVAERQQVVDAVKVLAGLRQMHKIGQHGEESEERWKRMMIHGETSRIRSVRVTPVIVVAEKKEIKLGDMFSEHMTPIDRTAT